jgi:hypothetical protein
LVLNTQLLQPTQLLECLRQWLVLLLTAALVPLLVRAVTHLNRFTHKFTFDQLILVLEAVKVSLP